MTRLEERLRNNETLLVDGAMGTLLQELGLYPGECPELWCITRPDAVREIHRRYREAGSDVVECNSFGGSRYKLRHYGLDHRVGEINGAAASLAREVAGADGHVLGSMGPTGAFLEPCGDETEDAFFEAFAEQALALEAGGADAVIVETMSALDECCLALRAIKECTGLTAVASFTFDPRPQGGFASMMGVRPADFARAAVAAGADIVGTNCGVGPEPMAAILRELREGAADVPLLAMPNAGMPVLEDGRTVFKLSPPDLARACVELLAAGASMIGGCCGTGPEHLAAMHRMLKGG